MHGLKFGIMSEALLEPWMICGLEKAQILDSASERTQTSIRLVTMAESTVAVAAAPAAQRALAEARKAAKTQKIDLDLQASLTTAMSHVQGFAGYMNEVVAT